MVWEMMILLPKEKGEYWGIGLIEVVWIVWATMVDFRLKYSVTLHNALHGFRARRGTKTVILESKLVQQLTGIAQEPLLHLFLDLQKAYDSLDMGWCMENLRVYGMGQDTARLISHPWYSLIFVTKDSRFLGMVFGMGRGVTRGDTASPRIFNIAVNTVVRAVLEVVCGPQEVRPRMGWAAG